MTDDRPYGERESDVPRPGIPDPASRPDADGDPLGAGGFEAPGYRPPAEGDAPADGRGDPGWGGSAYGQPQYGGSVYGGPAYGQPQYGGPQHGGPQYGGPQYGGPGYGGSPYGPQDGGPQDARYGAPRYGAPPGGYGPPASQPGIVPLRPLGVSDILSGAFAAIRFNPRTVLGYSAAFHAVALVVLLAGQLLVLLTADGVPAETRNLLIQLPSNLVSLVMGLVSTILAALIILPVIAAVRGLRPTMGQTWAQIRGRIPTLLALLGLQFLVVLVVVLVVGAVIVAAIAADSDSTRVALILGAVLVGLVLGVGSWIVSVYLSFTYAAAVAEGLGPIEAIKRSFRLVRGAFWRTWGIGLLGSLIVGAASMVATVPVMVATGLVAALIGSDTDAAATATVTVATALQLVVQTLATPFGVGVTSLLYIDRRFRTEGYALELVGADPHRGW